MALLNYVVEKSPATYGLPEVMNQGKAWFRARDFLLDVTTPPAILAVLGTTAQCQYEVLGFDKDVAEYVHLQIPSFPDMWYDKPDLQAYIYWVANASSGACFWDAKLNAAASGEVVNAAGSAVTAVGTTTAGTAYYLNITRLDLSAETFEEGDLLHWLLFRDATNAGDTLAVDADLIGALVCYNRG